MLICISQQPWQFLALEILDMLLHWRPNHCLCSWCLTAAKKKERTSLSSLDLKLRYNFQQYSFVICPRDLFLTTIMPSWCCLIPCELSVWWASWHGGWNYKATQETQTIHGGSHVWWFRCHYFTHEMQIWLSKASNILIILLCRCSSFDTNISNAFLLPAYFL